MSKEITRQDVINAACRKSDLGSIRSFVITNSINQSFCNFYLSVLDRAEESLDLIIEVGEDLGLHKNDY